MDKAGLGNRSALPINLETSPVYSLHRAFVFSDRGP